MTHASRPAAVRMASKHPLCFSSLEQWNQFRKQASKIDNAGFTYCEDCTAKYQNQMIADGRCAHVDVVFTRVNGELIGRRP